MVPTAASLADELLIDSLPDDVKAAMRRLYDDNVNEAYHEGYDAGWREGYDEGLDAGGVAAKESAS